MARLLDRVAKTGSGTILGADASSMAGAAKKGKPVKSGKDHGKGREPEWTSGLKQLYDSVVEEPLPDSFKDLLSRLDDGKQ
jgi:hypothetical protein